MAVAGDIKCENVLVTSWNWVYLADYYGSLKPTLLPADNPADFSFFFDTGGRRRCYLAPEVESLYFIAIICIAKICNIQCRSTRRHITTYPFSLPRASGLNGLEDAAVDYRKKPLPCRYSIYMRLKDEKLNCGHFGSSVCFKRQFSNTSICDSINIVM